MLLKDRRIFIVEDNLSNRVIFKMALVRHGATVEFDRWGDHSTYYLSGFTQVDLIILDLMLPSGRTGFDVFDQIRALPRFDRVPIVAVSAMDPALAIPRAQAQGFAGFISKPIDIALFPQQIARMLAGERIWSSSVAF